MSTFAADKEVEAGPNAHSLLVVPAKLETDQGIFDRHPLVPVFIAGFTALALSSAMIKSILLWLSLAH
jgi:hypothetical protein